MRKMCVPVALTVLLCISASGSLRADTTRQDLVAPTFHDVKAPSTYLYADKVAYRSGETATIRLHQSANGNPNPYCSYFVYLENLQTGDKLYHPGYQAGTVTDMFGNAANATTGRYPIYLVPELTAFPLFGPGGLLGGPAAVPSAAGTYRYVMELREATGTYVQSQGFAPLTVVEGTDTLSGDITQNRTLSNKRAYILTGMVFVRSGATLTIEPGTILFGETGTLGGLCIVQGAKINAVGTAQRPIVFTSANPVGSRRPGDWFGIAIAGRAPINVTGGAGTVEGIESVPYGGNVPDDDSGIMRYVRIEYAGIRFTPTREANSLYLNGVGSNTVLDHLHFNNGNDDNIEFFGGRANVKYVYCTGGGDDQFDWTEGWQGKAQFVITHVHPNTEGNRGIEADNWENGNDNEPRSSPTIYNMTIVGPQQNYSEGEGKADHGLMLRRGTAGKLYNFIVVGYGRDALNMRDAPTITQAGNGNLVFDNAILFNNGVFGGDGVGNFGNADTKTWIESKSRMVLQVDPKLVDPYNRLTADYMPGVYSPAMRIDVVRTPPDDGFFERVDFIGGIGPNNNWLQGGWVYITAN